MIPRIGIIPSEVRSQGIERTYRLNDAYAQAIQAVGGLPLILPYATKNENVLAMVDLVDGLLLTGGADVAPRHYGEDPKVGLGSIEEERDEQEIRFIHAMMKTTKPILGICRGMQIMTVALRGTLYQDLEREMPSAMGHASKANKEHRSHRVYLEPDSKLSHMVGKEPLWVNSRHHQGVKRLPQGFVASAYSNDGLIEAMEAIDHPYAIGVQWHPENLFAIDERQMMLFRSFVNATKT